MRGVYFRWVIPDRWKIDEDAIGGGTLRTVARDGISVIEMRMLGRVELDGSTISPCTIFEEDIILTRLFSRNARLTLAILPVLGVLSAQSLARNPRNSGAPVGYLQRARPMTFAISSPSFSNGGKIPTKFTCDGTDVSPALTWTAPPSGTESFTLIADDPDAPVGTWTHWVLFDLPAHTTALPEGVTKVDEIPSGGRQGRNDFRKIPNASQPQHSTNR